jgi:hypothetical protein
VPRQSFLQGDRVLPDEARLSWQRSARRPVLDDFWPHRRAMYDASPLCAVADFPFSGDRCWCLALGRNKHEPFDGEQVQSGQLLANWLPGLDNAICTRRRGRNWPSASRPKSLRQARRNTGCSPKTWWMSWTMNPAGQFTVSPSVEKLRGYTPQEVLASRRRGVDTGLAQRWRTLCRRQCPTSCKAQETRTRTDRL